MVRPREPQSLNFHPANRPLSFLPPARWPQGSRRPVKRNKIFLATKFGRRDGQDHQVSNFSFSNSNSGSSRSLEPGVSNTSDFQNPGLYRLRVTCRLPYLCHWGQSSAFTLDIGDESIGPLITVRELCAKTIAHSPRKGSHRQPLRESIIPR